MVEQIEFEGWEITRLSEADIWTESKAMKRTGWSEHTWRHWMRLLGEDQRVIHAVSAKLTHAPALARPMLSMHYGCVAFNPELQSGRLQSKFQKYDKVVSLEDLGPDKKELCRNLSHETALGDLLRCLRFLHGAADQDPRVGIRRFLVSS